ncbi:MULTISPECIES: hypothetical protein [unclassified Mycobacterium]|nr:MULTISPECIES: hypothetical protein [unclassified Mycobacterium]
MTIANRNSAQGLVTHPPSGRVTQPRVDDVTAEQVVEVERAMMVFLGLAR